VDKETRNAIERATQTKLLEEEFAAQLAGDFDVHQSGEIAIRHSSIAKVYGGRKSFRARRRRQDRW